MLSDYIEERYGNIIRNYEVENQKYKEQHQKDQEQLQKNQKQHLKDQEKIQKYENILKEIGIIVD